MACKRLHRFLYEDFDQGKVLKCRNHRKPPRPLCRSCAPLTRTFGKTVATVRLQARAPIPAGARRALRGKLQACLGNRRPPRPKK
ncbi:MAG: hypothetical protein HY927_11125 [Elusimicrobia bacterium]|nr:hypothetical protein [Elusimicrobiota bacterium]